MQSPGYIKKEHKVTAVYWVLAGVLALLRSSLTSIFLAILCKADNVKIFGYTTVGSVCPSIRQKSQRNSVLCCGTSCCPFLGGFVENFSSSYVCRFCLGEQSEFQVEEVRTGAFQLRTKQQHEMHVQTVQENPVLTHVCGVKRQCALTENLKYFSVLSGYPPDVLHDLFEGIVPRELAFCLQVFIKSKYFTLDELNKSIKTFPYKWSDKTDAP